jgi:hypothetical protein
MTYIGLFQFEKYVRHNRLLKRLRPKEPCRPIQIWTNYHVDFADVQDGYLCERLLDWDPVLSPILLDRSIYVLILIDEIQKAFPSARGASTLNQLFRRFLDDLRKANTELVCTTQFPQLLDHGLLYQLDILAKCYLGRKGKAANVLCECWDYWGQWTGKDYRKYWPPQPNQIDWHKRFFNVHQAWPHFQTGEIIPPIWARNRDFYLDAQGHQANLPRTVRQGFEAMPEGLGER